VQAILQGQDASVTDPAQGTLAHSTFSVPVVRDGKLTWSLLHNRYHLQLWWCEWDASKELPGKCDLLMDQDIRYNS